MNAGARNNIFASQTRPLFETRFFQGKKVLDLGCAPYGGLIDFADCGKYGVDHLADEYKKIGYPLDKHGINYYQAKSEKLPPHGFF